MPWKSIKLQNNNFMKCPYCNAEISDNSLFCEACGKKLPQKKECVKCGRSIDDNSEFCPYCGAKQNPSVSATGESEKPSTSLSDLNQSKKPSKAVSFLAACILALVVIGGAVYYWFEIREDYSLEGLAKVSNGDYELFNFEKGFAAVKVGNKMGVINKQGEMIAPAEYIFHINWNSSMMSCYAVMSEGRMRLAKTVNDKKKFGYIDKSGKEVIPFEYDDADNFSEGLARVMKNGKCGYIDKDGKEVIPFNYRCAISFHGNMALVSKNANQCEYIDKTGKVVASFDFSWNEIEVIANNGIVVRKDDKCGFVNNEGKLVLPCEYDRIDPGFCDDLLCVLKDNYFGYYNSSGKEIVSCNYGMGLSSHYGIAQVFDEWGGDEGAYIDSAGNVLFSFEKADRQDSYGDFYEDLAVVSHQGLFGFVDKTGKEVIPQLYESAQRFSEGLAGVKKEGLWGYIDKKGNEVIPFIYEEVRDFSEGLALIKKNGIWGYVDKKGKSTFDYQ